MGILVGLNGKAGAFPLLWVVSPMSAGAWPGYGLQAC